MKPREFDDLIRQKFDQNDFEYNPRNWERLEEQLEGKTKKRSIIAWWWMPLAGVAASVALAIGVSTMWRQAETGNAGLASFAQASHYEHNAPKQEPQGGVQFVSNTSAKSITHKSRKNNHSHIAIKKEEDFGITLQNALSFNTARADKKLNFLDDQVTKNKDKKKEITKPGLITFKPEAESKKAPTVTILLSGGYNQGNQNSGYVAGATIRRMVSDKVYIESDVAYVSSNNTQSQTDMIPETVYSKAAKPSASARTTQTTGIPAPEKSHTIWVPKNQTDNYTLSYAQVSPSIGVQIMKRMSIAAGPDFQQALSDNRPAPVPAADEPFQNVAVMPLFDMGLMGKTEYSITKRIKAQLSYRKGINNILTPNDKYIDRDYMQVQVRCAIFNK